MKYEVMVGDTETPPDGLFDEVRGYLEKKAGIGKWIGATGDAEIDATLQDFLADYFSEFAGVVTHYIVTGKVKPVPRATVASVKVIQTPAGPMVLAMGGPLSNHTQIPQDYLELAYRTYGQPRLITERLILDCSETNTEPRFIARRCTP